MRSNGHFIPSQYFRNQMVSSVTVKVCKNGEEVFIVNGIIGKRVYTGFIREVQARRAYMLDLTNTNPEILGRLLG